VQAFNGGCPKPAALAPYPEQRSANFGAHLFLPCLRWNYIEHVGCGRPPSPAEVIAVVANLHPQSGPLERATVPFQEEDHLPFRQQIAAPPVGNRTQFVGLGIGVPRAALADPVVQALVVARSAGRRQPDKEGVCLKVVKQVKSMASSMFGTTHERFAVGLANAGEEACPPRGQDVYGGARDIARLKTDLPAQKKRAFREVFEPQLAASRTVEEEVFELLAIQVAILVKGHQHRDVARGEALDEEVIWEIMASQDLVVSSEEVTGDPDGLRNQSWGRLGLL
jgi:hypothetical protein